MKVTYKNEVLKEIYETGKTKDKRYKFLFQNRRLIEGYIRAVKMLYDVTSTDELKQYSFLHYERLKYIKDKKLSSVRIANGCVERLLFIESQEEIEVELIEIDNTHYGNKK